MSADHLLDSLAVALEPNLTDRPRPNVNGTHHPAPPPAPVASHGDEGQAVEMPFRFLFRSIGQMCAEVDAAPPPRYIVRHLLSENDYGVVGAAKKLGKTWLVGDLAVTTAAGGAFLGSFPIDSPGPVMLFVSEGGDRKIVRRLRAVADFYGATLEDLPLYIETRAPKLASTEQLMAMADALDHYRPVLTIVDPAYLSLAGAKTADLVSMGELLERAQRICQEARLGLMLSHHWNKTGQGAGADRFTGSGFAEWGRVLISGDKVSERVDPESKESNALIRLEVIGDETPEASVLYRRTVREDRPGDLTSRFWYTAEVVEDDGPPSSTSVPGLAGVKPSVVRVYQAIGAGAGAWLDAREIGDKLADIGHPLKKRTILEATAELVKRDLVVAMGGVGNQPHAWRAREGTPDVF